MEENEVFTVNLQPMNRNDLINTPSFTVTILDDGDGMSNKCY